MQKETIGYIGPGIMGRPMIENLRKAGYPIVVYARREDARAELEADGINTENTPAAVAEKTQIIFSCVGDTGDVEAVLLGKNSVIETATAGSIAIDMSTISPEVTKEIAAKLSRKNIHMLDAPVSGGEQGAMDGTLSIMVGGEKEIVEKIRPLFEILGKNIIHVGGNGTGQIAKACNQVLVAQTITAVAEALVLAEAAGADPAKVREALLGGFAYSKILEVHGQRMLDKNYQPGFKTRLHAKDMRIVLETAEALGLDLQGAKLAARHIEKLVADGDGELDSSAIRKCIR